ncbi:glycosyltransferase [Fodinibius saliphilus]|uniref:glycosyltransferase n=1 Tax=Fodinibius saliphilus TaxID=1920650 RepID=UPI0011091C56|nr:glycosyltransferase [Fodinibius saliphilus]
MSSNPTVSFIICTYNRQEYLDDTLESLVSEKFPQTQIELLIVDNNSKDNTPAVVQKYQQLTAKDGKPIRYIKERNQGLSHARNRGIAESKAPYIVFLDDDIRATSSLIPAWVSFFESNPEAVAAGGKIHVQFDDPRPSWMSHFLLPLLGYHDLGDSLKTYPKTKYPFGGNMGFKKNIFEQVATFNIELGRKGESLNAGEEKELFRRIREQSNDIYYLPDAFLYHRVNKSRLTVDYIRKQALGLGKSMHRRLKQASTIQKAQNWFAELFKLAASFPLGFVYLISFQLDKAIMLFKFRWWIWKGYNQSS